MLTLIKRNFWLALECVFLVSGSEMQFKLFEMNYLGLMTWSSSLLAVRRRKLCLMMQENAIGVHSWENPPVQSRYLHRSDKSIVWVNKRKKLSFLSNSQNKLAKNAIKFLLIQRSRISLLSSFIEASIIRSHRQREDKYIPSLTAVVITTNRRLCIISFGLPGSAWVELLFAAFSSSRIWFSTA